MSGLRRDGIEHQHLSRRLSMRGPFPGILCSLLGWACLQNRACRHKVGMSLQLYQNLGKLSIVPVWSKTSCGPSPRLKPQICTSRAGPRSRHTRRRGGPTRPNTGTRQTARHRPRVAGTRAGEEHGDPIGHAGTTGASGTARARQRSSTRVAADRARLCQSTSRPCVKTITGARSASKGSSVPTHGAVRIRYASATMLARRSSKSSQSEYSSNVTLS